MTFEDVICLYCVNELLDCLLKDITQEDFVIQDINFEVIEFATMD